MEHAADISRPKPQAPLTGPGDFAASLPAPIRKKFKALRERAECERALSHSISDKRAALMTAIPDLEEKIEAMTLPIGGEGTRMGYPGRGLAENSAEVTAARLELASLREDMEGLNASYGRPAGSATGTLVSLIENFLRSRRVPVFEIIRTESPTLPKGTSLAAAIESRRRRLRELDADLKSVASAPLPSRITKQLARKQLAELSEQGRPDVFALVERGQAIGWPIIPIPRTTPQDLPSKLFEPVNTAALIAWALGPALIAALDREIEELSDDDKALTQEQRKERTDQILADKLATEREEESLIERAEIDGLPVHRRLDADPRAILGIR
jgi:hypothetical protein